MIDFNKLTIRIKILFAKIKHRIARRTYKELPAPKFSIGDMVVVKNQDSFSPFEDVYSNTKFGTIEDIFMGSKQHSHQDWYYTVVFIDDTVVSSYNRTRIAFNHWEIELDKAYLRAKRFKELGI
jgi:hypothetical protein